ncbi:hypothetical protein PC116_g15574 [Phytophthora cactorum]|uniref:Uncharacterized protein n=1 Tax=Phytophthora cactorum TaxID=29920 RepID=A0A329RWN6_9STRA|nr:hypothetical protein Pcac1_g835 [Phytophthora cactorum]KAG2896426.1 hypothetical protein PC114_g15083 [Phytophthora cactorum]KAG2917341.1 hypothetical protein PC117_g17478 [Phytophthora cactorum]KAG2987939.1 hypothetical protein PC119_g19570 [Phytophthora cactorum]KAG3012163.1 hypothetical protein PC120_g14042 [Phytophthora cactorum]
MDPTLWIKDDKYFGENFHPVKGQVYVLVVVPKQWTSMPTVSKDGVSLTAVIRSSHNSPQLEKMVIGSAFRRCYR